MSVIAAHNVNRKLIYPYSTRLLDHHRRQTYRQTILVVSSQGFQLRPDHTPEYSSPLVNLQWHLLLFLADAQLLLRLRLQRQARSSTRYAFGRNVKY